MDGVLAADHWQGGLAGLACRVGDATPRAKLQKMTFSRGESIGEGDDVLLGSR